MQLKEAGRKKPPRVILLVSMRKHTIVVMWQLKELYYGKPEQKFSRHSMGTCRL